MPPEDQRFEKMIQGLEVDAGKREQEVARGSPPRTQYVIIFSARSGSSWLTSVLSATGQLGRPEEFINPAFVRDVAATLNATTQTDFLDVLRVRNKSQNGVFGIEARAVDIELFGEDYFFDAFGAGTMFFNLWRENIVAQALSLYRAVESGRFHSTAGGAAAPPPYDAREIARWLRHLALQENENVNLLQKRGIDCPNLRYENIIQDRAATIRFFAESLNVGGTPWAEPMDETMHRKIGDNWNKEAEARFRTEEADFVAEIRNSRKIRGLPQFLIEK